MSANSVSTPRPSTTVAADRSRAAAKARPQSPSPSEPKPPKGESIVSKALDEAGLDGAASEARRGSQRIKRAADRQPTPERAVVATVVAGAKAGVAVANAAAGDVADKVGKAAQKVGEAAKPVVDKVVGPTIREGREAAREIGQAGRNVDKTAKDGSSELRREVSKAWNSQPTIERQVVVAGYEVAENLVQGTARNVGALANLGKEVLEGGAEVAIHNPAVNALRAGGEAAADGIRAGAEAAVNGVRELFSRGAKGAAEAGKTTSETRDRIEQRSEDQRAENAREVGDAAREYGRGWVDSVNPFDHSEVTKAWNDQPTIERQVVVAGYEVVENAVQDAGRNAANAGRLVAEIGEAAGESVATTAQNVADEVAGGVDAAGKFLGRLFGG